MQTAHGPLEDVPPKDRKREWPPARLAQLEQLLPLREKMEDRRFSSCAVVGSSPELLLYKDGKAIDAHEAVFRANLAVTSGYEAHAGSRTTVRVINPVESHRRARKAGNDEPGEMIIKNQDPPIIRSPSREISKFVGEASGGGGKGAKHKGGGGGGGGSNGLGGDYLARRSVLELCNYLMLASSLSRPGGAQAVLDAVAENAAALNKGASKAAKKAAKKAAASGGLLNLTHVSAAFRAHASGAAPSWHPLGDGIPRFSPIHCSTGSVLLTQALLACDTVTLYGYHACTCHDKCDANAAIGGRNHYWDKKETPRFGEMMARYEHHLQWYQHLEKSCELDFSIARREHCDKE